MKLASLATHGGHNATVKLDTGPDVAVDILFAHPRNKPSANLHESLGLATVNTPLGIVLKVDERRETSMPGIYAAGCQSHHALGYRGIIARRNGGYLRPAVDAGLEPGFPSPSPKYAFQKKRITCVDRSSLPQY